MQLLGYKARYALDAAHSLYIKFLRWELQSGVTRVHSGKLDMFGDGISYHLAVLCHSVEVYLLGILDKLAHDDRML